MICQKCGKEIPNDSVFCPECGSKQETELINEVATEESSEKEVKRCINCGAEIPIDGRFCPQCRADQEATTETVPEEEPDIDYKSNFTSKDSQSDDPDLHESAQTCGKRKGLIAVGVLIGVVVVIAAIVALILLRKPTIDLNKYISISADGYNTVGKASVKFDTVQFEEDYEQKLSKSVNKNDPSTRHFDSEEDYLDAIFESMDTPDSASLQFISTVISGDLDKKEGLNNGDIIHFKWDCQDDLAMESYGVKLQYSDIEYTVEGLQEAQLFNPFDDIEIEFSGISPDGRVEISNSSTSEPTQDFVFKADKRDGLELGDTITVSASIYGTEDIVKYCIDRYGMIPEPLSKEYKVSGLDSYIRSFNDVSEDSLVQMQSQAEDVFNAKVASDWKEGETLKGFDYIGNYLLTTKEAGRHSTDNILYLVYKVTVNNTFSNDEGSYDKNNAYYWYISFSNLLVNDQGETTVNITQYKTPSKRFTIDSGVNSGWFSTKEWRYIGYEDLQELYKETVTVNIDSYNHEDNVDEEFAPAPEKEEGDEQKEGSGFIFPNSSEEIIDKSLIKNLSDEDLRYAINEIYARHGYIFKDDSLRKYYEQFDWYKEEIKPDDFTLSLFNSIESKNVEAMQKERDSR